MADLVLVAVLVTNTYICLVWLFNLSRTLPPPPSPSSSSSSSSSDSVVRVPFHEIPNSFHRLMVDHAMVSERNIDAGRYHTLVTHGFTHLRPMHLLGNMLVFVAVGRGVILAIGVKYFWLTYAAGAIAGGVASVQMDRYLAKKFPEA